MAHRVAEEVDVELDDIWLYIARQSGSIEIADKIVDSITLGLRSFPVGNYVIVYCIEDEDAAILHVFHRSRDIESFFRH